MIWWWTRYYSVAGVYNYKGQDFVIFYSYNRDGSMRFKRKKLTAKNTASHFFTDTKINKHFKNLMGIGKNMENS